MSMVALDLETTGLDIRQDKIIEIGIIRFDGAEVLETYQTFVNPDRPIPPAVSQLTHITNPMVTKAPHILDVLDEVSEFVGSDTIVGHNIGFDLGFLRRYKILTRNRCTDTYELASVLLPRAGRYKLSALAEQFGIDAEGKHRALADCTMTMKLYNRLLQKAYELPFELLSTLINLAGSSQWNGLSPLREVYSARVKAGEHYNNSKTFKLPTFPPKWDGEQFELKPAEFPKELDSEKLSGILSAGGAFSRHDERFEPREQQIEMLQTVCDAFSHGHHMLIEAGTGTGKSFAYLIPAFQWAMQNGERVVISTNTINLQDQLINKDIPQLEEILETELRATVQKGRSNYLCPKRLAGMQSRTAATPEEMRVLGKVFVWLSENGTGDRGDLNVNGPIEGEVWGRISAENEGCRPNLCPFRRKNQCPFYSIRAQAQHSHVIIVNHALLLADAVYAKGVIPDYKYLIIDEGHHLESAATGALSFRTSLFDINRLIQDIGTLNSGYTGRLLTAIQPKIADDTYEELRDLTEKITEKAEELGPELKNLFDCLRQFMDDAREGRPLTIYGQQYRLAEETRSQDGWDEIEIIWSNCETLMKSIIKKALKMGKKIDEALESDPDEETDEMNAMFQGLADQLKEIHDTLEAMFMSPDQNMIYWIDLSGSSSRLSLCAAPLSVGPMIQESLWNEKDCVILTSATLTTSRQFDYMRERLAAEDADEFSVGSPFDYEKAVLLCTPRDVPEPNQPSAQYVLEQTLINLCRTVGGRTLVLFTSYAQLKRTSNDIQPELSKYGITVFEQGEGVSPSALLKTFRNTEKAILLGTRSFWEGVDIQGDALSVVVIAKLPFDVPSDPIVAARAATFENSFGEYSLPEAILKFRQGFGRLIRSNTDKGLVIIMDNRINTKRYGLDFINSIPKCTRSTGSVRDLPRLAEHWLKDRSQ
ncbi:MAG: DEAD/DEAH box helicase [Anaerolineaceae bacterium]|nr:DEAD/DEAH box helicase [Anaerolineaceae bacterium]